MLVSGNTHSNSIPTESYFWRSTSIYPHFTLLKNSKKVMFTRRVDLKESTLAFYIFEIVIIADQRCTWERFQLGFLHSPHRHRILLYAQPCPWRSQRVFQDGHCSDYVTTIMITMQ